jgi:hypothetical protein
MDDLKVNIEIISRKIRTIESIHRSVDQLQLAIFLFYFQIVQPRPLAHQGWLLGGISQAEWAKSQNKEAI